MDPTRESRWETMTAERRLHLEQLGQVGPSLRMEIATGKNHHQTGSEAFTAERLDWLFGQKK